MEIKRISTRPPLRDLRPGQTFVFGTEVFMRVKNNMEPKDARTVVNLISGDLVQLPPDIVTEPFHGHIQETEGP